MYCGYFPQEDEGSYTPFNLVLCKTDMRESSELEDAAHYFGFLLYIEKGLAEPLSDPLVPTVSPEEG